MDDILMGTEKGKCILNALQKDAKAKGTFPPTEKTILNTYLYRLLLPHFHLCNIPCPKPENLTEDTATNMDGLIRCFFDAFTEIHGGQNIVLDYPDDLNPIVDLFEQSAFLGREEFVKFCTGVLTTPKTVNTGLDEKNTLFGQLNDKNVESPVPAILNGQAGGNGYDRMTNAQLNVEAGELADGAAWGKMTRQQKINALRKRNERRAAVSVNPSRGTALVGFNQPKPLRALPTSLVAASGQARSVEQQTIFKLLEKQKTVNEALRKLQRALNPGGSRDPVIEARVKQLFKGYLEEIIRAVIRISRAGGQFRLNTVENQVARYIEREEERLGIIGNIEGRPARIISTWRSYRDPISGIAALLLALSGISAFGAYSAGIRVLAVESIVFRQVKVRYSVPVVPLENRRNFVIVTKPGATATYVYDPLRMVLTDEAQALVDVHLAEGKPPSLEAVAALPAPPKAKNKSVLLEGRPQITTSGVTGKSPQEEAEELEAENEEENENVVAPSTTALPYIPKVASLNAAGIKPIGPPKMKKVPAPWTFKDYISLGYFAGEIEVPNTPSGNATPQAAPGPTVLPRPQNRLAVTISGNTRAVTAPVSVAAPATPTPNPIVMRLGPRNELVVTAEGIVEIREGPDGYGPTLVNPGSHFETVEGGPSVYNKQFNDVGQRFIEWGGIGLQPHEAYDPMTGKVINTRREELWKGCMNRTRWGVDTPGLTAAASTGTIMAAAFRYAGINPLVGFVLGFTITVMMSVAPALSECGGPIRREVMNTGVEIGSSIFWFLLTGGAGIFAFIMAILASRQQYRLTQERGRAQKNLAVYNKQIYGRISQMADAALMDALRNSLQESITYFMTAYPEEKATAFFVEQGLIEEEKKAKFIQNMRDPKIKNEEKVKIREDFMYAALLPLFIEKWYDGLKRVLRTSASGNRSISGEVDAILLLAQTVANQVKGDREMLTNARQLIALSNINVAKNNVAMPVVQNIMGIIKRFRANFRAAAGDGAGGPGPASNAASNAVATTHTRSERFLQSGSSAAAGGGVSVVDLAGHDSTLSAPVNGRCPGGAGASSAAAVSAQHEEEEESNEEGKQDGGRRRRQTKKKYRGKRKGTRKH